MDRNTMYEVKNRSSSMVIYTIPELNIRREFAPGETKRISFDELEKLSFQSGGRELMASFLLLRAVELTNEFGIKREQEYDMDEKQIAELIMTGSLDAFLDALDFAPIGVIDLIKTLAVSLPMNSLEKRAALKKKTGFDVTIALANKQKEMEAENAAPVTEAPQRRVITEPKAPTRRVVNEYKVVSKSE